jgi:hypothetical protein
VRNSNYSVADSLPHSHRKRNVMRGVFRQVSLRSWITAFPGYASNQMRQLCYIVIRPLLPSGLLAA